MKTTDIILYLVCLFAVVFSLYALVQLGNAEQQCTERLDKILEGSPCDTRQRELYIIPIDLGGLTNENQSTSKDT
jgi:hypothetical protein